MKDFKLNTKIQLILVTALVIILGMILVSVIWENKTYGMSCHEHMLGDVDMIINGTTASTHTWVCPYGGGICYNTVTENHYGGSHDNGGKCTATGCETVYQTHSMSSTGEYDKNSSGHALIRKCNYSGCNETSLGTRTAHTASDTCTICGYYTKTPTTKPSDGGNTCSGCGKTMTAESRGEETHVYVCRDCYEVSGAYPHTGGESNNGRCTVCNELYISGGDDSGNSGDSGDSGTPNPPAHTCSYTILKHNDEQHWMECSCGAKAQAWNHKVEEWKDDGNGKHSGTCVDCPQKVTKEHKLGSYTKKDGTNHTRTCEDCGYVETKAHTYGEYTNEGNGKHSKTCIDCAETVTQEHNYGEQKDNGDGTHSKTCKDCSATEKEDHSFGEWKNSENGKEHERFCTECNAKENGAHTGATHEDGRCTVCKIQYEDHKATGEPIDHLQHENMHIAVYKCAVSGCTENVLGNAEEHIGVSHESGGKCTACQYQCEEHKPTTQIVDYTDKNTTTHTPVYKCSLEGCTGTYKGAAANHTGGKHTEGKCKDCDHKYQNHQATQKIVGMNKTATTHTPIYACSVEGCESTFNGQTVAHTGATHKDGRCTACQYLYEIHENSNEFVRYEITETGHTKLYKCKHEGCTETYKDEKEEAHTGATHDDGRCTVCQHQYEIHEKTNEIYKYEQHPTIHITLYKCSHEGCTTSYVGEAQDHFGATHGEGKCTACQYQYEIHENSNEFVRYEKTETGHTKLYKCKHEGCTETYKVEKEEAHTGATHEDGRCTVCEYQYQKHEKTNTKSECIGHENGHTTYYKCSFSGCKVPFAGVTESHTGATHNDGRCKVCQYKYQDHGVSTTFAGYKQTSTGHTKTYKCTFSGCEEVHIVGNEEKHTGATHDDGRCTVCQFEYEHHGETKEIVGYAEHESTHNPLYKCTQPGCTQYYQGLAEEHSGATHDNGGKCNVCKYTYQKHNPADKPDRYETTENNHTPIYKCTFTGCIKTHKGETENHIGGTHENGGKCEECKLSYQTHGVSNEVKNYDIKEQNHTPIYKCTYKNCEGVHVGTTENHTGGTHDNGGKCTSCLYQYQRHEKTDAIAEYKQTETGHTPMYKCSQEGCVSLYAGCEVPHTLTPCSSNGSETHGSKCTICNYEIKQNHNYDENGICEECGERQPRLEISSKVYEIDDLYISKVKAGTTVKEFINNIETNATEIKVYDTNNEIQEDSKIMKTGMKLEAKYLDETRTFSIAVSGDVTGNGKVEFSDMIAINMHLLSRRTLEKEYFIAADVTRDKEIGFNDFLKINMYMLSRISEL